MRSRRASEVGRLREPSPPNVPRADVLLVSALSFGWTSGVNENHVESAGDGPSSAFPDANGLEPAKLPL